MDKHRIKRREWSEATYVYSNPDGDPFRLARKLTLSELFLKGLGLGLFWGEGTK
ncbi:MAG: hypothetical protein HY377_00095, partial [Candidatus Blackburnbacteria bacterium]|nr:hypothetical protein [Candidatus Blackburnbacteria bacterium]